ncbi:MAG TPA: gliding motility-associated C-terminal domain-containing protein [Saprospiraceae bacterium]|nr:gliding motility-associated C-terminal domain-containing protein [Saprospiraceae bacterium]
MSDNESGYFLIKHITFLILFCFVFVYNIAYTQTYYALDVNCSSLYSVQIDAGSCSCELTPIFLLDFASDCVINSATCSPEGDLYAAASNLNGGTYGVYKMDFVSGHFSCVYPFPANAPPILTNGANGIAGIGNSVFYILFFIDHGSTWLYRFNANEGILTSLGTIGYFIDELAMYEGEIYGTSPAGLIKIDTLNPANSILECNLSPFPGTHSLTASPVCHSLIGNNFDNTLYNFNLLDCSITALCTTPVDFAWIVTTSEFTPSATCSITIDLDCDDSSGAPGSDYNTATLNCLTTGGVKVADEDVNVLFDDIINEMTIMLNTPLPDGVNEVLIMTGSVPGISVSGSGTNSITFSNNGNANSKDFTDALQLLVYDNITPYPSQGLRTVSVQFTTNAGSLSNQAFAFINVIELMALQVDLGPDQELCDGLTTTFDAGNSGAFFQWSDNSTDQTISADNAGVYSVTVSDGLNCPGQDTVELDILPIIHISLTGDDEICENQQDSLIILNDSPFPLTVEIITDQGSSFTFNDVSGNFVFTDLPLDDILYSISNVTSSQPSCIELTDPDQFVEVFPVYDQDTQLSFCDGDSVLLGNNWISSSGIFNILYHSIHLCDSSVQYTVSFLPSQHISMHDITCDSAQAGVFISVFNNQFGCDSIVTKTVSLVAGSTTFFTTTTCDSSQAGMFVDTFTNQNGCDSILFVNIVFANSIMTNITALSCDSNEVGISVDSLTNQYGCDSIVTTSISFSKSDYTILMGSSCDSADTGVFVDTLTNLNGCDSIVETSITYSISEYTFITYSSCDSGEAGIFIDSLVSKFGCDSIVETTITYHLSDNTFLLSTSCDSSSLGVFVDTLQNQKGCDSIVTKTIEYAPNDLTYFSTSSCNPDEIGVVSDTLINLFGCDSIVVFETLLFPLPELNVSSTSDFTGFDIRCYGENNGSAIANVSGVLPFLFTWSNGGLDQNIEDLASGLFTVTITDANGCQATGEIMIVEPDPLLIDIIISEPDCFEQQKSSILINSSGGVSPVQYSLDSIHFQPSPVFNDLPGGMYQVIIIDANQCVANENIMIHSSGEVNVDLGPDITIFPGDTVYLQALVNLPIDSLSSVTWSGIVNLPCPSCLSQTLRLDDSGIISVSVTSVDGCEASDTVIIFIEKHIDVYVPNIFSPNGDNINDRLIIAAGDYVKEIASFIIYDRWGNMVFSLQHFLPNDPNAGWDGTFKNIPLNSAVFTYRMIAVFEDGRQETRLGDVTLLR